MLHRVVGGREAWRAQLRQIAERAGLPTVTVQVIPQSVAAPDGWNGMFIVLSFPDAEDPDMAYVEHGFGSVHIEREDEVNACRLTFDHLASLALSPAESVALIERVAAEAQVVLGRRRAGMPTVDLSRARWRTSSRSAVGNDAACVEVAFTGPRAAVRDSKNGCGPVLVVPAAAWQGLLGAAKRGRLDMR